MTRKLLGLDRLAVLLVGVALVVLGLLAIDWRQRYLLDSYADTLATGRTQDLLATSWWPWVFALVGILLGLIGLVWLLAHLRREGPTTVRMGASDATGRIEVDVRSVASAAATHLGTIAPVINPRGTTRVYGATTLVEVRGRVDPAADPGSLIEAAEACSAQVAAAFPDDRVECRVVLDAPRSTRPGRADRVRVR